MLEFENNKKMKNKIINYKLIIIPYLISLKIFNNISNLIIIKIIFNNLIT